MNRIFYIVVISNENRIRRDWGWKVLVATKICQYKNAGDIGGF